MGMFDDLIEQYGRKDAGAPTSPSTEVSEELTPNVGADYGSQPAPDVSAFAPYATSAIDPKAMVGPDYGTTLTPEQRSSIAPFAPTAPQTVAPAPARPEAPAGTPPSAPLRTGMFDDLVEEHRKKSTEEYLRKAADTSVDPYAPEVDPYAEPAPVSGWGAAGVGLESGATLGYSPELRGARASGQIRREQYREYQAALRAAKTPEEREAIRQARQKQSFDNVVAERAYEEQKAVEEERQKQAQEQHPYAYMGGKGVGMLAPAVATAPLTGPLTAAALPVLGLRAAPTASRALASGLRAAGFGRAPITAKLARLTAPKMVAGAMGMAAPGAIESSSEGEGLERLKNIAIGTPLSMAAGAIGAPIGQLMKAGYRGALNLISGKPTVRPYVAPRETPFSVITSEGQATGEQALIRQEQAALKGDLGEEAKRRALDFAEQQKGQLSEAKESLTREIGVPEKELAPSTYAAADRITGALKRQKDIQESALQQRTEQLSQSHKELRSSLNPAAETQVSNPLDAANVVSESVERAAEASKKGFKDAYAELKQLPGQYHPASFNKIGTEIKDVLNQGDFPIKINPQNTPQANYALGDLEDILGGLKQVRNPATGKLEKRAAITPDVVESVRKRLNSFYGAAKSAASKGDLSDVKAMRGVMDAFDDAVLQRLEGGRFIGGDPTKVINTMKNARELYAGHRKTFTSQGAGDAVGSAIEKILGRFEGQQATEAEVASTLFGGAKGDKGLSIKVGERLLKTFGEDSPEIGAIRQGLHSHITEPPPGAKVWGPSQIADRIDTFTEGPGRKLTQTYLKPKDVIKLREHSTALREHAKELDAPKDAAAKLVDKLAGEASEGEAVGALFRKALGADDSTSIALGKRIKSTFGETSSEFSNYKQGLLRHALEAPRGKLEDWGPKEIASTLKKLVASDVGKATYTPQDLKLINTYADLQRKLIIPPGAGNKQNVNTKMLDTVGKKLGEMVTRVVSSLPVVGGAAGELAASTIGKHSDMVQARIIAKQMPLITDALETYKKAALADSRWKRAPPTHWLTTELAKAGWETAPSKGGWKPNFSSAPMTAAILNLNSALRPLGINLEELMRDKPTPTNNPPMQNTGRAEGGAVDADNEEPRVYPPLEDGHVPFPPQRQPLPPQVFIPAVRQHVVPEVPGMWSERDAFFQRQENERSNQAIDQFMAGRPNTAPVVPYVDTYESKGEDIPPQFYDDDLDGTNYGLLRGRGIKVPERAKEQGRAAGGSVSTNPTASQKRAGNYTKAHINFQGLELAVENPKGSNRSGVSKDGDHWTSKMPAHYGYIKGTVGKDKDQIDAYIGPHKTSKTVFVIDQLDADGVNRGNTFDEHKVLLGFGTMKQALDTYKKAFSDGKGLARVGAIYSMTMPQLKEWLAYGNTKASFTSFLDELSHLS